MSLDETENENDDMEYVSVFVTGVERKLPVELLRRFPDSWFGMILRRYEQDGKNEFHITRNTVRFNEIIDYLCDIFTTEKCVIKESESLYREADFYGILPYITIKVINKEYHRQYYTGEIRYGVPHGHGTFTNDCPAYFLVYTGEWKEGQRTGKGEMKREYRDSGDIEILTCEWEDDYPVGDVVVKNQKNRVYKGGWNIYYNTGKGMRFLEFGLAHGEGKLVDLPDTFLEGKWENGKYTGSGRNIRTVCTKGK